jgi:outer membrane receptor protein involved in Fe transport
VAGHFWERPFHSLNFVANKSYNKNLKISFKVNNLLKQKVRIAHFYQDKYYITQEYDPGRSFSVSIQFNN